MIPPDDHPLRIRSGVAALILTPAEFIDRWFGTTEALPEAWAPG